ncbi:MAG: hypothetical protein C0424_03705 [Sphingobacteriaceae bacterium]|nr:hypothetical protein [Sphingobacteriaceae bacterium]
MKKLAYLLFSLLVFTGCREKLIDTTDLNIPERLVVGCFISPQDDTLYATVTLSRPLYGQSIFDDWQHPKVTNATVTIRSANGNSAVFSYNVDLQRYLLPASAMPIVAGQTYTLEVTTPDGKRADAQCTVPTPANFQFEVLGSLVPPTNNDPFSRALNVDFRWQGQPDKNRFYRLNYAQILESGTWAGEYWQNTFLGSNQFYADTERENKRFRVFERISLVFTTTDGYGLRIKGVLQELDENSYRYFTSVSKQLEVGADGFSEPVVIFSNVNNGLGCFGASYQYTLLSDTLAF